jgi:hypothetical protein
MATELGFVPDEVKICRLVTQELFPHITEPELSQRADEILPLAQVYIDSGKEPS